MKVKNLKLIARTLEDIGVDIAVQGGAIFGWTFTLFRVSK